MIINRADAEHGTEIECISINIPRGNENGPPISSNSPPSPLCYRFGDDLWVGGEKKTINSIKESVCGRWFYLIVNGSGKAVMKINSRFITEVDFVAV